jgi:heptosyltransferase-2
VAHLVFQTAFPGDLFLSIPLIRRIRDWEPETEIVLACRPGLGEYFLNSGLVSEVIEIDKRSGRGRRAAMQQILARQWDVVFVPHESVRTALWMWKVRASRAKIGFRKWWNRFFYSHRVVKPMGFPDAMRQLSLLTPLDGRLAETFASREIDVFRNPTAQNTLEDFRTNEIPRWASMTMHRHNPGSHKVFLAPGSVWNTKRWKEKGYEALASLLLLRGYSVELVGSAAEKALCDEIAAHVPGVINHAGKTSLGDLVNLFAGGGALVCNDSGAMHAAAVAGLPTVAIFGPTVLALGFRPWQDQALVVQRPLGCRPCGKHGAKSCPIGTHECMEAITPGEVLGAVEQLLPPPKS